MTVAVSEHVVALLRAMNTGGNRFPMADLRAALTEAGFADPRTLLASGNVVVRGPADAGAIERVIEERFGLRLMVVTRTGAELARVLGDSPFAQLATDGAKHFVAFAGAPIDPEALEAKLGGGRGWGEERWAVRGRELYLWLPDGMGRSALAVAADKPPLGPAVTVRNANTVVKLVEWAVGR